MVRETLVDYVTVDGEVGYGPPEPVQCRAPGTVTWLAPTGSTVQRGQPLLRVDEQPVVLLYGPLPMYRTLAEGTSGRDVAQFEANLDALGYTGFTVDQTFSAGTTAAVRRWQHDLGLPAQGTVAAGQVIYAPGPLRIARHLVRVGAPAPADVLLSTATTRLVTATVPAAEAGWAAGGARVSVVLPDSSALAGTVDAVSDSAMTGSATTGGGATGGAATGGAGADPAGTGPSVEITIAIADQTALAALDRGRVEVRYARAQRADVLTVPVGALLALAEGGYGLEVVDGGASRIVAVQTGMFAGGRVEVSGAGIDPGVTVRMPA